MLLFVPLLALFIAPAAPFTSAPEDFHARALRIHRSAIVVDTHEDLPYWLEGKGWAVTLLQAVSRKAPI